MCKDFKRTIDRQGCSAILFEDAWKVVDLKYEMLKNLFGGLPTRFTNTATVESHFFVLV